MEKNYSGIEPKYFVVAFTDRDRDRRLEYRVKAMLAEEVVRKGFNLEERPCGDWKDIEFLEWGSAYTKLGARILWNRMQRKYIHPQEREKFPEIKIPDF